MALGNVIQFTFWMLDGNSMEHAMHRSMSSIHINIVISVLPVNIVEGRCCFGMCIETLFIYSKKFSFILDLVKDC